MQNPVVTFDNRNLYIITCIISFIVLVSGIIFCGRGADSYRYKEEGTRFAAVTEHDSFLPAVEVYKRMKTGMDEQTGGIYRINTTGDGILGFFQEKSGTYDYMIACMDDHDQIMEATIREAPARVCFFDNSGDGLSGDAPLYFMRMFFEDISLKELRTLLDRQIQGYDESVGGEAVISVRDCFFHIAPSHYPIEPAAHYVLYVTYKDLGRPIYGPDSF